jgi:endoglucanase
VNRPNRRLTVAAIALAAVAVTALVAAIAVGFPLPGPLAAKRAGASRVPTASPTARTTVQLGQQFLHDWVQDGRVIRRDQGGDTVSEGQSYGMLIALGVRDKSEFTAIWNWTKAHLMRSDGLFAWRWQNGAVVDDQPASDADLEIARALLLAGTDFQDSAWTKQGTALADAIATHLTVETGAGRILLPGLWAAGAGPYSYNPSYAAPEAIAQIAQATSDPRWTELEKGTRAVAGELLQKSPLPPDWAQVEPDGSVNDLPGPTGQGPSVRYSFDAARFPINAANSCDPTDSAMSAGLATTLGRQGTLSVDLDLGASPLDSVQNPVAYLARASARAAHGSVADARADIERADKLDTSDPTYYGAAWTALAPLLLDTTRLGGCPPLAKDTSS